MANITKEKAIIMIEIPDKGTIKLDLINQTITSYTGRIVKNMPSAIRKEKLGKLEFIKIMNNTSWETLKKIETFWMAIELVNLFDIPNENPKGYIKWVKENQGKDISNSSLREFKKELLVKDFSENDKKIIYMINAELRDLILNLNEDLTDYDVKTIPYSIKLLPYIKKLIHISIKKNEYELLTMPKLSIHFLLLCIILRN